MFSKFISVLLLAAPLVSAITLNPIEGVITSGGPITITWTPGSDDPPTFSFELLNPSFNNAFAIANNVDPSLGTLTVTLGVVPVGTDYTIEAVNIGNINQVYSTTPVFSIGTTASASGSTATAVTGTSTNTNTPTTANLPVTASTAVTGVSSSLVGTSTGTGVEGTSTGTENSPTATSTENSPSATGTGTGTSSTSSATPSSAAVSSRLAFTNAYGYAVLLLSAVGGAVAIAL